MIAFKRVGALALGSIFFVAIAASQAGATVTYPDHVGPGITFTGVQETSAAGPEPLWDAPTYSGDQMLFFPTAFKAETSGGGVDFVSSQLQAQFAGTNPTDTITEVNITEFGDYSLLGFGGTAGTGAQATMAGFLTVLEDIDGPLTGGPVVIPFTGTYTPVGNTVAGTVLFDYPNDFGTGIWSASISVDISAYVENATVVQLSLDNSLLAASEAGTSSLIQKKVVDGPAVMVEVVPEPGTAILVGGGLFIMALRGRRNGAV